MPHAASLRIRPTARGITYDVRYRLDGAQKTLAFPNNETQARDFLGIVRQHGPEFALSWVKRDVGPKTPTVAEYAETYIASKSGVEGKTLDHYRMFMRRSIGPWMGHLPLNMVTPETIAGWINEQSAPTREVDGKLPKPLGAKTIKNRHGFLYAMFQHAVQRGVVDRNPCEGSNMPSSESREMTFLSGDEYTRLLSFIPPYWQPLVQTLAGTGMRWSEATALRPGDFDLEAGVVRVSRAWKDSQAKGRYLGAPKTSRSKRTISLPSGLIALLRPLVEQRGEARVYQPARGRDPAADVPQGSVGTRTEPRQRTARVRHREGPQAALGAEQGRLRMARGTGSGGGADPQGAPHSRSPALPRVVADQRRRTTARHPTAARARVHHHHRGPVRAPVSGQPDARSSGDAGGDGWCAARDRVVTIHPREGGCHCQ